MTFVFLLLLQGAAPEKYAAAAAGVELAEDVGAWRARSEGDARVVDLLSDRENWARGLQRIDQKLALFVAAPRIRVILEESDDPLPAKGGGRAGIGEIRFNVARLVEYQATLDRFDEMSRRQKDARYAVPPASLRALVHHELVHCFVGALDEAWATEGIAAYVAGDTSYLWGFQHRRAPLRGLDEAAGGLDLYARGYCAFAWMESRFGAGGVAKFAALVGGGTKCRAALEAVAGREWAALVPEELAWTREHLKRYTPRE